MASLYEAANDTDEREDEEHAAAPAAAAAAAATVAYDDGMPVYDPRLARVRKAITSTIKPFHGQTELDKYNVLDWVEHLDTQFTVLMGTRQAGRLDIVRSVLAGGALKWMNRKVLELNDKARRGELSEDIEWEAMRKPFIDAHLGIHTIETFKAQLRALRLGATKTPTPVELNQEFDHLAGLAYPDRRSDMRDSVLGDEYGKIIAASNMTIYKSVAFNQNPSDVEEWKLCVSRRWAAGKHVEAVEAQVRGTFKTSGGGHGGRQGRWQDRMQASDKPAASKIAAMQETDGAGQEGAQRGEYEDETQQEDGQLKAARGDRGGGGGRGGRGRGGASQRPPMTEEQHRRYVEGLCIACGEQGHIARHCSKVPQQGKGKAGQ
jgi:hypothetical protein